MSFKSRIIALVPLRGGSKSIPLKNIKKIAGKPLCEWVLEAACNANNIDEIYVSTDSEEIINVVSGLSLPVKILERHPSLATDTASTESVMLDFMSKISFDILVTIQATSPLTLPEDFDLAIDQFMKNDLDSLLTGVRIKRFFWNNNTPVNYNPLCRPRRQDFKGWIVENGAFYLTRKEILNKLKCRLGGRIGIYEMSSESIYEIDEPSDWDVIENILIKRMEDKR